MKKEEFCNFIGIDVSKKTLDGVFIFNKEADKSNAVRNKLAQTPF